MCGLALAQPTDSALELIERGSAPIFSATVETPAFDLVEQRVAAPGPLATMDEFMIGMSHGDVQPYAAPVVDLGSGRVAGYQGLARWHHPRRGVLEADAFTGLIASSPLANEVDLYVAREVAAMLTVLARENAALRVYAPASKRLVADIHTEQYLWEIADAFSLRMEQLCLQVGCALLDSWSPALQDALASLRDADVTLVVTGVDGVDDARRFVDQGFHELHLAPSLSGADADDAAAWSTVDRIVAAAHAHERRVAATALTDVAQRDAAVRAGVDLGTGPLYGLPAPTDTIE